MTKSNLLKDKLLKNTTIKHTSSLERSEVFNKDVLFSTDIPMLNVALSGRLKGGMEAGILTIAGPSRHFKTAFGLKMCQSFLSKYSDGIVLFYDSEFGTPASYIKSFGVEPDSMVHTPITNIEELKHDLSVQLENIARNDRVLIFIDSIGNLASKKEVDDAISGNTSADMTRAKQLKSMFRIVTPHISLKNLPCVVISHTYKEMSLYPKDIVSGGTGGVYSSDDIWIIGRSQDKDGKDLVGFDFTINIEKSRTIKEKSKIPISVSFESGISRYSGLLDLALEGKFITSEKKGWYIVPGIEKNYRKEELENDDSVWTNLLQNKDYVDFIEQKYLMVR